MASIFRIAVSALFLAGAAIVSTAPAMAANPEVEAAKDQGVIGERIDGYLGIVEGGADPSLARLVQDINNRRRAAYGETADRTGTTPQQVARVTGERLIEQAEPGEYIMDDSGSWSQK
ncbi:YdbL family protein [Henriciella marina]|uniref:YdbL family protein n=1 Tax=Henriciella marina TaxID=453851 RepID=UPI000364A793|nr:YdbL family protein [Henriciella marina]